MLSMELYSYQSNVGKYENLAYIKISYEFRQTRNKSKKKNTYLHKYEYAYIIYLAKITQNHKKKKVKR